MTREKFKNNNYIQFNLISSDPFIEYLTSIYFEAWLRRSSTRPNKATRHLTEVAINSILTNLFRSYLCGVQFVSVSMNRNTYRANSSTGITWTSFRNAFDCLTSDLVVDDEVFQSIIIVHIGFQSRSGYRDNSKLEINHENLRQMIAVFGKHAFECGIELGNIYSTYISNKISSVITPITNSESYLFERRTKLGSLRMKDDNGRSVPIPETEMTTALSLTVDRYNRFLQQHTLALLVSDEELGEVLDLTKSHFTQRERLKDLSSTTSKLLGWEKTAVFRSFSENSLNIGGRFYGGWWQNIPRGYRKSITINGSLTVELDYKGLHVRMLYHTQGLQAPEDPYAIDGFPSTYRESVKRAMMALLNAKPNKHKLASLEDLYYPEGWNAKRLEAAIRGAHRPIAEYFRSSAWGWLQRLDSDIANRVIEIMLEEHGALVLPIHDSFIVQLQHEGGLMDAMERAYQEVIGPHEVLVERKSWGLADLGQPGVDQSKFTLHKALNIAEQSDTENIQLLEQLISPQVVGTFKHYIGRHSSKLPPQLRERFGLRTDTIVAIETACTGVDLVADNDDGWDDWGDAAYASIILKA